MTDLLKYLLPLVSGFISAPGRLMGSISGGGGGGSGPVSGDGLLLESGDYTLLESGDFTLLE